MGRGEPEDPNKLIADCYAILLRIPHGSMLRFRAQNAMARCVDYLAERSGVDAELLQNAFEARAAQQERADPTDPKHVR